MVTSLENGFNFDEWSSLADSDPAAFEAARDEAIKAFIQQIPEERQQRLTGLQWRIDNIRAMAPNPTASFLHLSDMMWESFYRQQAMLKSLLGSVDRKDALPKREQKTASVVPFRLVN
ncbi:MAG TPA: DUF3135 domain-containing protein [Gammaproteobacteria bacterium]|nr:DUF3135 domain-containing protein [Gammaproteobacteria bacterium]